LCSYTVLRLQRNSSVTTRKHKLFHRLPHNTMLKIEGIKLNVPCDNLIICSKTLFLVFSSHWLPRRSQSLENLSLDEGIRLLHQVRSVIDYLHSLVVTIRIKPASICLRETGDFVAVKSGLLESIVVCLPQDFQPRDKLTPNGSSLRRSVVWRLGAVLLSNSGRSNNHPRN
jgi:hypothetical protein